MITLEAVNLKLDHISQEMEKFFKTMNTPDNIVIKKDRSWGQRSINIYLRLDEFSVEKLKEYLPKLEELFALYKEYRKLEKDLNDKADIERATTPGLDII
jgi:predicted component of type VI protein secretion system